MLPLLIAMLLPTGEAPRVREVHVEGADAERVARALESLRGDPATPERLVAAVRGLERDPRLGGVDLELVSVDPRAVDLVVRLDGLPRRVASLRVALQGAPEDAEASWRLAKQIQAVEQPFRLTEGRPFHPYLLRLDLETVRRYYLGRGHRHVQINRIVQEREGLVEVLIKVTPGPRFRIEAVEILGFEEPDLLRRIESRPGGVERPVPWIIEADAERIRGRACRKGFPQAKVRVSGQESGAAISLTFTVEPGPARRVGQMEVVGYALPPALDLALHPEGPFCPDLLDVARAQLEGFLRDHGHPRASLLFETSARGDEVDVKLTVDTGGVVRVGRVWFEGNLVTSERVLRQRLSVEEGAVFSQAAIDSSVQSLLRSGLFKQVHARVLPGAKRGEAYVSFTLVERELVSIDVLNTSLTLHNLDVTDVEPAAELLESGATLRGAGQELTFYAQDTWQGLRYSDRFVERNLFAEAELNRRLDSYGSGLEEAYYELAGGVGLKGFGDRVRLLPRLALELSDISGRPEETEVLVADGLVFDLLAGLRARLDIAELDEERVRYLGVQVDAAYDWIPPVGDDLHAHRLSADLKTHLPLGTNFRGQHYVLTIGVGFKALSVSDGRPAPHLRGAPRIRGYGSIVVERILSGEDTVKLGGTQTTQAKSEVRVPMPYARRHAIAPFFDVASIADEGDGLLDGKHVATGVTYHFSFMEERLEGFVYGVYPFNDEADREFLGLGVDGSF